MRRTVALVMISLSTLVACAGDDGGSSGEDAARTTAREPTATPTTTVAPPVVDLDDRLDHRFEVPGGPDAFTVASDALWVKTDAGSVVRIDPATNEVVAEVEVTDDLCQGIGTDQFDFVVACDYRDLARIDPRSNEVAETVAADKIAEQRNISGAFAQSWVLTGDGSTLVGIRGGETVVEIDLGLRCTDLAVAYDTGFWLTCGPEDAAVLVDLDQRSVVQRVDLTGAGAIATSREHAWVAYDDGIAQLDVFSGEQRGTVAMDVGRSGGLFVNDVGLWARTPGAVTRIDPNTREVIEHVEVPEESGGSVIVAFGSLWISAYDDAVVYRLNCGPAACS
jgi:hypothetical protein